MFIDKDSFGRYSINDLNEKDLYLFYEALKEYVQHNVGRIHPNDNVRIFVFDEEFNGIMKNETICQTEEMD